MKPRAQVAAQFKRSGGAKQQKQQRRKARRSVAIVRPWMAPQYEELLKEERDIVLGRLQKEVVAVPSTRSRVVLGVNQVTKAAARGELRVVVFANNPETLAFGHVPLLCRLHRVPVCVLHLSSKTFGRTFGLKSLVAMGIRVAARSETDEKDVEDAAEGEKGGEAARKFEKEKKAVVLTDAEKKKVESIADFLVSKASKRTRP